MQYQGHKLHHESGGAILEIYYRHDEYNATRQLLEKGYYYSHVHNKYNSDSWGNYGFQDSVGYRNEGYPEYGYHPHGGQEGLFYISSLSQGEGIYDSYAGGYMESANLYVPTPYHAMYDPCYDEWTAHGCRNYESYVQPKEETRAQERDRRNADRRARAHDK
jgi:hypothetical protein